MEEGLHKQLSMLEWAQQVQDRAAAPASRHAVAAGASRRLQATQVFQQLHSAMETIETSAAAQKERLEQLLEREEAAASPSPPAHALVPMHTPPRGACARTPSAWDSPRLLSLAETLTPGARPPRRTRGSARAMQ
eukprot:gene30647-38359_t